MYLDKMQILTQRYYRCHPEAGDVQGQRSRQIDSFSSDVVSYVTLHITLQFEFEMGGWEHCLCLESQEWGSQPPGPAKANQ